MAFEALLLLRLRPAARRPQVHPRRRAATLHRVLSEETRKGKRRRRQFCDENVACQAVMFVDEVHKLLLY